MESKQEWLNRQEEHMLAVLGYVPQEPPSHTEEKQVEQVVEVKEEPFNP
jgi:hypothetical protein